MAMYFKERGKQFFKPSYRASLAVNHIEGKIHLNLIADRFPSK